MHDDARNVLEAPGIGNELVIAIEESGVLKVMALDTREGEGVLRLAEGGDAGRVGKQ